VSKCASQICFQKYRGSCTQCWESDFLGATPPGQHATEWIDKLKSTNLARIRGAGVFIPPSVATRSGILVPFEAEGAGAVFIAPHSRGQPWLRGAHGGARWGEERAPPLHTVQHHRLLPFRVQPRAYGQGVGLRLECVGIGIEITGNFRILHEILHIPLRPSHPNPILHEILHISLRPPHPTPIHIWPVARMRRYRSASPSPPHQMDGFGVCVWEDPTVNVLLWEDPTAKLPRGPWNFLEIKTL
jgi:hypothetical protein